MYESEIDTLTPFLCELCELSPKVCSHDCNNEFVQMSDLSELESSIPYTESEIDL